MAEPTIIVTGGASGIGLSVAKAVLGRGWRVAIADRDEASLARAEAELGAGDRATFVTMDVTDEESVVAVVADLAGRVGPIGGLVNSAGIGRDVPALETSVALFRQILEINLLGSFAVSREVAKAMIPTGGGSIVNIASVSGIIGNEGRVAYGASKGGVVTMTMVMAVELAQHGIRVNAIAPGPIETPLAAAIHTPAVRETWHRTVPQARYGTPEEVATTALFLLDGAQSGYITGQTIAVDGGFVVAGLFGSRGAS
ncbi:SDR family NAD(P)-dependent oxidoreductase [Acuticoccus kandeliae]|uniref:SDR family NAD(P)-dependent oxidoreductase n=1 Tax=Acuticoccus kandeliae TaxID=2073160 RepID=UPI000D3ED19D|nr:SDR family oxidoreductase [Acuticoccus kandeliae]